MTSLHVTPEALAQAERVIRPANAFFLRGLVEIVGGVTGLAPGDEDFDYFISVPLDNFHVLSQQISDLEYEVKQRYEVRITALPIPAAS